MRRFIPYIALVGALGGCGGDEGSPGDGNGARAGSGGAGGATGKGGTSGKAGATGKGGASGEGGSAGEGGTTGKAGSGSGGSGATSAGEGGAGDRAGAGGDGGASGGSASDTIGPDGGEVSIEGASVTVPAGALESEHEIAIEEVDAPVEVPEGYTARSPVYAFTPHGLAFESPVTIELDYTGTADAVLRLEDDGDTTWEAVNGADFDDGTATLETSSFSYYVVVRAQPSGSGAVAPLYPSAPNLNQYVENDGADGFRASGTLCDNQWWNYPYQRYSDCIHSGEHRIVEVSGRSSCDGLTAEDALGAFDWTCEVLGGTAALVSTGFRDGAGFSTLVDFSSGSLRENSVTVFDGESELFTTPDEVWWTNPVEIDNDGMFSATAGTIYLVTQSTSSYYELDADGSALLVRPGVELTGPHVPGDGGRVVLDGFGLAFEGRINGTGNIGLRLSGTHFYVRNTRVTGFSGLIQAGNQARLENLALACEWPGSAFTTLSSGSFVRNVKIANCENAMHLNGALSVVENVIAAGGNIAIVGSNNVAAGLTAHHSSTMGVSIGLGDADLLMHVTTAHNLGHGLMSYNSSGALPRQVIGLLATENRLAGISLDYNTIVRNAGTFANTHYGVHFSPYASGNTFVGSLAIGFNGSQPINYYTTDPSGCYDTNMQAPGDCYGSRANTSSGTPNGLLTLPNGQCDYDENADVTAPFNPPQRGPGYPLPERVKGQDGVNPDEGPDGTAPFAAIENWLDFENFYRGWGSEGPATPSCDSQGPCSEASTGPSGCQIFDYRLRYDGDTFIARAPQFPDGDQVFTHVFGAGGGSAQRLDEAGCAARFTHSVFDSATATCTVTFLANAREILGDLRGNDNLLCESGEVCLFTPNIASYQGEGAIRPIPNFVFVDGIISDVTLLAYETNGADIPYSP